MTIHAYTFILTLLFTVLSFAEDATHFRGRITPIPPHIQTQMKQYTWHKDCPVPLEDLRYLRLSYWGFDKHPHLGALIVNKTLAKEVVTLFHILYLQRFPIERMALMDAFKGNDNASMAANNTSAFNCREVTHVPGIYSQHSYGRAIDINPKVNPFVEEERVSPPEGVQWKDRKKPSPGKINRQSLAYSIWVKHNWDWGGNWFDVQDYQHFEKRANGEKRNPYGYTNTCAILTGRLPERTTQALIVQRTSGFNARLTACERTNKTWHPVLIPIKAVMGRHGIAAIGEKKEGDGKTPAGMYPLGEAFGTRSLTLHMDYKHITSDDKFIDDPSHPKYNTWVSGPTDAKSYETMLIPEYQMGAIINYNMNPTIPGKGSAIFMHIWRSPTTPTAGCVAMDEASLSRVLHWLDKKQHPYVVIQAL